MFVLFLFYAKMGKKRIFLPVLYKTFDFEKRKKMQFVHLNKNEQCMKKILDKIPDAYYDIYCFMKN